MFKTNKESYIEYLKKSNEDFEISNDYLEGKKEYEQMDLMEKADIEICQNKKIFFLLK